MKQPTYDELLNSALVLHSVITNPSLDFLLTESKSGTDPTIATMQATTLQTTTCLKHLNGTVTHLEKHFGDKVQADKVNKHKLVFLHFEACCSGCTTPGHG